MSFNNQRNNPRKYKTTNSRTIKPLLNLAEAKKKLMDFVARRDHTEKELTKKLSRYCDAIIVKETLDWAIQQNWLASPEKISSQFVNQLERRGKGIRKINQKLKDLGLAPVKSNKTVEFEKAKKIVLTKWSLDCFVGLDYKEMQKLQARISRFLNSRGFESDIITLILKNEFKKTSKVLDVNDHPEEDNYDDEF